MRFKKSRVVPNVKGCGITSVTRTVRGEPELWEKLDRVAALEKTNRNELIVRVLIRYCERKLKRNAKRQ